MYIEEIRNKKKGQRQTPKKKAEIKVLIVGPPHWKCTVGTFKSISDEFRTGIIQDDLL